MVSASPHIAHYRRPLGLGLAFFALIAAIAAALIVGPKGGALVAGVEGVSTASGTILNSAAAIIPFGYAFGAGMVAAVNPCGFVLLPAYLGLFLGLEAKKKDQPPVHTRIVRALQVGGVVTLGFVLLFGATGLLIAAASTAIAGIFPWLGFLIGILLALAGGWLLGGGTLYARFGEQVAGRLGRTAGGGGVRGYFAYGLAYGATSLSCTLPIFLAVVGSAFAARNFSVAGVQFLLYALGMGFVITLLTLGLALFQQAAAEPGRRLLRYAQPVSAALLLLAGAYIVFYWLTIGGLLPRAA